MKRSWIALFAALMTALSVLPAAAAPSGSSQSNSPDEFADRRLSTPIETTTSKVAPELTASSGRVELSVRLSEAPVATGGSIDAIEAEQADFIGRVTEIDPDATVIASVQTVLNAVFVAVSAGSIQELAMDATVVSVRPVGNYQIDLSETVPYIGAEAVQSGGNDGSGVKVAVLDSGIDYLHAALGGSGDPDDFEANDPTVVEVGTFPTAKVVGGTDFVGSSWPDGDLAPDDDPLDDGPEGGHGTHVAHIIGGNGGVAPGVDLYAVKVCSSVSTSCSGIALIEGMDWAVAEGVDVINMSLGSPYGQAFDDDLSLAVDTATIAGVLTVASAGNSSDKPYITGSPAAAPSALSVAQTQVPSASLQLIDSETVTGIPAVFQPWSTPFPGILSGPLQYGDGAGGNLNGCAPFAADSLTGLVVLVDRGACNFTLKIYNIELAGGIVGIIGLVAPGAPFSGGDGGDGPIGIPGYMISQSDSNSLKAVTGETVTVDPGSQLPLVGQMVGSSSRGPSMQFNSLIKPEIGAPGASVSAIAGSGTEEGPFGGTSGAAPMVTGSAALLIAAHPDRAPAEVKAALINTGETNIATDPFTGMAPITRIGGGEVRVDRALASDAAAWEASELQGALSFGFLDATSDGMTLTKTIHVENYGSSAIDYDIVPTFRYDADETGAVVPTTSVSSFTVDPGDSYEFDLTLTVNASLLDDWYGNSGDLGADPSWLTDLEFDGYVMLDAESDTNDIHLPWHVLPRKSAEVSVASGRNGKLTLSNEGAGASTVRAYNLIATSDQQPTADPGANAPVIDLKALGYATYAVPAGYCGPTASSVVEFAVTTWERQTHANAPATFDLYLDYDGDGFPDANVFNYELSLGDLSDGRNLTWAVDYSTGALTAYFFTEHQTNSANTVLTVCADQIGLKAGKVNQASVYLAFALDNYFTGDYTDVGQAVLEAGKANSPITFQGNNGVSQVLPAGASVTATFSGNDDALLLFSNAAEGEEALVLEK